VGRLRQGAGSGCVWLGPQTGAEQVVARGSQSVAAVGLAQGQAGVFTRGGRGLVSLGNAGEEGAAVGGLAQPLLGRVRAPDAGLAVRGD